MLFRYTALAVALFVTGISSEAYAVAPACEVKGVSAPNLQTGSIADLFDQSGKAADLTFRPGSLTFNFQSSITLWEVKLYGCNEQKLGGIQLSTNAPSAKSGPSDGVVSAADNSLVFILPEIIGGIATRMPIDQIIFDFKQPNTCVAHISFIFEPVKRTPCLVHIPESAISTAANKAPPKAR